MSDEFCDSKLFESQERYSFRFSISFFIVIDQLLAAAF